MFDHPAVIIALIAYAAWIGVWTGMWLTDPDARYWTPFDAAWRWGFGFIYPVIGLAALIVFLLPLLWVAVRRLATRGRA